MSEDPREERARPFFCYRDKNFSFTGCYSFVLMQELRIPRALTLDHHFRRTTCVGSALPVTGSVRPSSKRRLNQNLSACPRITRMPKASL